ncbi:MAG: cholestenol Delta-isomerase [Aliidongia sp.]|nr:cholestenol Delta-isomerase [Aliidongia sp.]
MNAAAFRPPLGLIGLTWLCMLATLIVGTYWLVNYRHLPVLAETDSIARLFRMLAPADRGFFDAVGQRQIGLVGATLLINLMLYLGLSVAWFRASILAVPLALSVGAIGCYAAIINGWICMIDGFSGTARTSGATFLLFGLSAAWFGAHLALILDVVFRVDRMTIVPPQSAPRRARLLAGQIWFFTLIAWGVELPWLLSSADLPSLDNAWKAIWAFYGRADRGYFDQISSFERGLEGFHVFVTQWLYLWLLWELLRPAIARRPVGCAMLQIMLGSYVAYSTIVYLAAKHISGYPLMPEHDLAAFLTLYLANLPWVVGNLVIAADGARQLIQHLSAARGMR